MSGDHPEPDPSPQRTGLDAPLIGPGAYGVLLAVIIASGLAQALTLAPTCDVVVLLHEAGRLMDGARLYVDLMEVNPPLIVYLNLPVAAMARVLGISPPSLLPIFVFALAIGSLGLCHRLRSCLPTGLGQVALLIASTTLLVFVGGMFGQREHLMLILILPYAFSAAILADGGPVPRGLGTVTGLMAGVGFAIKPHFVPAFLAVELYLGARRGFKVWGRAQAVAAWGCLFTYAAAVLALTPEYLPYAWSLRDVYRRYTPNGKDAREQFFGIVWLLALSVVLSTVLVRRRSKGWSDVLCLLAVLLLGSVFAQGKWFLYHWYPVFALSMVLLGVGTTALALRFSRPTWWANAESVLALLVPAACALTFAFWSAVESVDHDVELDRLLRDQGRGQSIYALSSLTHPLCLAERNGVGWATDNYSLLPIQAYYGTSAWRPGAYHAWDRMPEEERRFLSHVVADLERARPALLLVDKQPPAPEMVGFDYLAYFGREPRFPRVMAGYRFLREFQRYRVYEPAPTGETRAGRLKSFR